MEQELVKKALLNAAVVLVAGATYFVAQTSIDVRRAESPVKAYLRCVERMATYDWAAHGLDKPSTGEVCGSLTGR
jgi:hypothetical protein